MILLWTGSGVLKWDFLFRELLEEGSDSQDKSYMKDLVSSLKTRRSWTSSTKLMVSKLHIAGFGKPGEAQAGDAGVNPLLKLMQGGQQPEQADHSDHKVSLPHLYFLCCP